MAAMMLTSCVKDMLFDTPHPNVGILTVTTDWSGKSTEAEIPSLYILLTGDTQQEVSGKTNRLDKLLIPGNHTLTIYNVPQEMKLNGSEILVEEASRGEIVHNPGYVFYGNKSFDIPADTDMSLTVPMSQITRRLEIVLTVADGNFERVANATGTLDGICPAFDIETGLRSEVPAKTTADIVRERNKLLLEYNLLGIAPQAEQTLTVAITYINGDTQTLESNLSAFMYDYHGDTAPMRLTGNVSLPGDSQFTGAITGWKIADGGNFNAN